MSRSTHPWFTDSEDWSAWTADKTALLKAFVDFVLGTEGQGMLSDFSFTVVPAAMNTWSTVWTSTIVKPAGFGTANELTFEGNTEKWVGQGANVVSSKRDSYSLWKLNDLESSINSMKDWVVWRFIAIVHTLNLLRHLWKHTPWRVSSQEWHSTKTHTALLNVNSLLSRVQGDLLLFVIFYCHFHAIQCLLCFFDFFHPFSLLFFSSNPSLSLSLSLFFSVLSWILRYLTRSALTLCQPIWMAMVLSPCMAAALPTPRTGCLAVCWVSISVAWRCRGKSMNIDYMAVLQD